MPTLLSTPTLRLASGPHAGHAYEIRRTVRIGRHPYNTVSLGDQLVSRYHCWIKLEEGAPVLEDLKSGNGTFVNGERVGSPRSLKEGDRIRVGATEFTFTEAA